MSFISDRSTALYFLLATSLMNQPSSDMLRVITATFLVCMCVFCGVYVCMYVCMCVGSCVCVATYVGTCIGKSEVDGACLP